jgi:hypothetical protein
MHVVAAGGEGVEGAGQTGAARGSPRAAWQLRRGLVLMLLLH